MNDREQWDELHAEFFDKLADDCDGMSKEWASKHCIDGYIMAAKILVQKETYKRMAWSMRQPRYVREENEALKALEAGDA